MEIRNVTHVQNIRYDKEAEALWIIDQTLLPNIEREIRLTTAEEMYEAIRRLQVRGAPAIGICAGYCMYALAREIPGEGDAFYEELKKAGAYLNSSRPTAVNLSWAIGKQLEVAGRPCWTPSTGRPWPSTRTTSRSVKPSPSTA